MFIIIIIIIIIIIMIIIHTCTLHSYQNLCAVLPVYNSWLIMSEGGFFLDIHWQ